MDTRGAMGARIGARQPAWRGEVVMVSYALVTATNGRKFMIYFMSTC